MAKGGITEAQGESQRRNLQDRHESEIKKLNKQVYRQRLKLHQLAKEKIDEDTKKRIVGINERKGISAAEAEDEVAQLKRNAEFKKKKLDEQSGLFLPGRKSKN